MFLHGLRCLVPLVYLASTREKKAVVVVVVVVVVRSSCRRCTEGSDANARQVYPCCFRSRRRRAPAKHASQGNNGISKLRVILCTPKSYHSALGSTTGALVCARNASEARGGLRIWSSSWRLRRQNIGSIIGVI